MNDAPHAEPPPVDPQTLVAAPNVAPGEVIRQQATSQDYLVLRMAVVGLIIAIVIALLGTIVLIVNGQQAPDGVVAIGSAGVGALATMLVRPPSPPSITNVVERRN